MTRSIRGAVCAEADTKESITAAVTEMISEIISRNGLNNGDICDIIFAVTGDITAMFPAAAVRALGITDIPLLDTLSPAVRGALPLCIRVLVHVNTDDPQFGAHHVYLGRAASLRPDLASE